MAKIFNYTDAVNMIKAVCSGYLSRDEIVLFMQNNFEEGHKFTEDELKQTVRDLTANKTKPVNKTSHERYKVWPNVEKKYKNDNER